MKKEIGKKLLSIMLTLALVFTMMPMMPGAVSKAYAEELTKISSLEATSKFADKMKVGKTVPGFLPFPVVTVGQPANVNPVMMFAVYKKNESGVFRYVPSNTPVEPGIYQFKTYVSLIQGQGYELDPEMTVTIDGKTCTHDGTITVENGNVDTITITSGEYEVVAPPDLVFTDSDTLDIPMGEVNEPIDTFSLASYANGGTAPYTFSKKSGPEWITVSSDGTVSGTPTQVTDANEDLVVQVTDSTDPVQTAEISISVGKTYSPIAVTYVNFSCIALDNIFNIGNAVTIPGNSKFIVTGSSLSDSSVIGISNGIGNSPKWKKLESNTWTNLTSTDVFERGGTYKLTGISFYADHTKVKFDEDTVVTVNGNEWEISYIGQNPGYTYVEIESPAVTLREVLKEEKVALASTAYTYDGAAKEPATIVKNAADEVLVEGTDYEVSYTNNTNAGTATVTVEGIGNYSGTVEKTFEINGSNIATSTITLSRNEYTYDGTQHKPGVTVEMGETLLVEGTDFEVYYLNNKNAGTATVRVEGRHNYNGYIETTFTITPCTHTWDGGTVTTAATCTTTGVKTYTCTIPGCGETKTETIAKAAHSYSSTYTVDKKATTSADGSKSKHCTRCDAKSSVTAIPKISSIKLSATSYVYNGRAHRPAVTVKDRTGKTLVDLDYTVYYASGRKYVGKYAVKVTFTDFTGKYSGTKTLYFNVKPKSTSIASLSARSKGFYVKWNKQATQTTGYQIQYSTSSKFTKSKTVTISKNSTTSKTISKLTGKKKYYVRVRTYKTVKINGKATKIYSSWSKVKYVTTKA